MASTTLATFFSFSLSFPKSQSYNYKPSTYRPFSNSFYPISSLKVANAAMVLPKRAYRVLASNSTTDPHENISSSNALSYSR
ncbi:hypothetical protein CRYUN_Cryun12cG0074600 [Craigia yunnanensis]